MYRPRPPPPLQPPPGVMMTTTIAPCSVPSYSAADSAVPAHSSEAVAARFEEAQVYRHDKGHALPCRAGDVDALLGFIMRHLTPAAAATAPRPDQPSAGARADARAAGARPGAEAGAGP